MNRFLQWACLACSSTLGTGFVPGWLLGKPGVGGGFAGALVTLIVLLIFPDVGPWTIGLGIFLSFVLGMIVVGPAEKLMLSWKGPRKRHTGEWVEGDFNETNIDEVHGMLISALPIYFFPLEIYLHMFFLIIAFISFRIFDTTKFWPINAIEDNIGVKGGPFNVMIDDTAAGVIGAIPVLIMLFIYSSVL